MDLSQEEIEAEFARQVKLCSGIGRAAAHDIVDRVFDKHPLKSVLPDPTSEATRGVLDLSMSEFGKWLARRR